VATRERLYLIDPLSAGPLDRFWQEVVDPRNLVVVHAGREEVRICHLAVGQAPGNVFDIQVAAPLVGLAYPLGHAALANQLLGVQLAKGETLTEWRERPLTPQQIRYAFDDVRHLLAMWEKLDCELQQLGRTEWAREEFTRLSVHATPTETVTEKWRKLRGLGSLDRRRLAAVRELFQWREDVAARTNRPPRTFIRDDLVVEIARRNPRRESDLEVMRGLPRRDLTAIVQCVEKARALPIEECPAVAGREQDPPQVALVSNLLSAVLGDLCARMRLAPNFVANNSDVKLLVRAAMEGQPPPDDSSFSEGWRQQFVLPELQALLEGRRSVRIANLTAETPFAVSERG